MHRGRLQSQGGSLNDSEAWSQIKPLTRNKGIYLSHTLEGKATGAEAALRQDAHDRARKFIDAAHKKGGVGVTSKTYMVKGDPHRRVDIEVRAGLAFK